MKAEIFKIVLIVVALLSRSSYNHVQLELMNLNLLKRDNAQILI